MVTDESILKQSKEIENRLLNRITDPEEKSLVAAHFKKLEAIKAKYDPYRTSFPEGLDGGSTEEKKEIREEELRFFKAWQPYLDKRR